MYKAKVKWNGNHYFAGEEVKGSKLEKREEGTTWLFDDDSHRIMKLVEKEIN